MTGDCRPSSTGRGTLSTNAAISRRRLPPPRGVQRLPRDYTTVAAERRMAFLREVTGASPEHLGRYSFDPSVLAGNIENFVGVAQAPIGSPRARANTGADRLVADTSERVRSGTGEPSAGAVNQ